MLDHLGAEEAKRITELARAARLARDLMIEYMKEAQLAEPPPAKGPHNAAASLAFDPLPADDPALSALREAIDALPQPAREELLALARVGKGDHARDNWAKAVSEAEDAGTDMLLERVDLHDQLAKGLYELRVA